MALISRIFVCKKTLARGKQRRETQEEIIGNLIRVTGIEGKIRRRYMAALSASISSLIEEHRKFLRLRLVRYFRGHYASREVTCISYLPPPLCERLISFFEHVRQVFRIRLEVYTSKAVVKQLRITFNIKFFWKYETRDTCEIIDYNKSMNYMNNDE